MRKKTWASECESERERERERVSEWERARAREWVRVRERERERERERVSEWERERERGVSEWVREREREREREWVSEWERERAREREWVSEWERERESEWVSEWVSARERVSEWVRERVREWESERARERESDGFRLYKAGWMAVQTSWNSLTKVSGCHRYCMLITKWYNPWWGDGDAVRTGPCDYIYLVYWQEWFMLPTCEETCSSYGVQYRDGSKLSFLKQDILLKMTNLCLNLVKITSVKPKSP